MRNRLTYHTGMKLGNKILKELNKLYVPSTTVNLKFEGYDLDIVTDPAGRPILLFMGKREGNGKIRGTRYVRRLKFGAEGNLIKDHWEQKGPATP
jgi:hypothetical protein